MNRTFFFSFCAVAAAMFLSLANTLGLAADWNQWRGPSRDGTISEFALPSPLPPKLTLKWETDVGKGYSSPLVVGDGVFVFSRENEDEVVRRIDFATGKVSWRQSYAAPYEPHSAAQTHGSGPKATPLVAEDKLFTFGISGILTCFDTKTGQVIWQKSFAKEHKKTSPLYGVSVSPVFDDGAVIVHVGGHGDGALMAFDAKTGAVRWRWNGDGPAYASPIIVNIAGVRQVVTQTQTLCAGFDAHTGKLLWSLPFTTPYDQNAVTPVVAGDLVVFGGTRQPTFAVRVRKDGDQWSTDKVWQTNDVNLYMSTPVLSGTGLIGMSERRSGQLFMMDAATGRIEWSGTGRLANNASVSCSADVTMVLTTNSELLLLSKKPSSLDEIARYKLGEKPIWASPAFSGHSVIVKDSTTLMRWDF